MNVKRSISTITAITTLAATGIAGAADAPTVSEQHVIAGAAPVTIPGTGIQKGEWMGSKAVAVYKTVTIEGGQKAKLTLKATNGRKIRGIALTPTRRIGSRVLDRDYVGKRQVTVELSAGAKAAEQEVTVYALTN